VAAVGEEGDRRLCDEVADARFGTPSLAAAAVVPSRVELEAEMDRLLQSAEVGLTARLGAASARLAAVDREASIMAGLGVAERRMDRAALRLRHAHPGGRVAAAHALLVGQRRQMEALSPARVLERGYAVMRRPGGTVVRR